MHEIPVWMSPRALFTWHRSIHGTLIIWSIVLASAKSKKKKLKTENIRVSNSTDFRKQTQKNTKIRRKEIIDKSNN